jgi:YidC/Oxa1 family membrane protein insertase
MNIRELLLVLALALGTSWGLQYFIQNRTNVVAPEGGSPQSGQRFTAPKNTEIEVHKPINVEIDFLDVKSSRIPVVTTLDTTHARYEFSADGAVLNSIEFKRNWGGKQGYLATIFPPASPDKERGAFLVALQEKTPFYFELLDKKEESDRFVLTYRAKLDSGTLTKQFVVFKDMYRIDLVIGFDIAAGANPQIQPRIFYPSPLVPELSGNDTISGISNDERNHIKVYPRTEDVVLSYWSKPTLFGSQDRYFVHAMVHDRDHFVQRAYYKVTDVENLYSILEGPTVGASQTWNLTFYVGPKEDDEMNKVDSRLEETLNYGWFSFISKPFSKLMLWSLNKIYDVVHNYGWALIILTIIIKLLMLPFTWKSEQSARERLELQKKLEYIQQKYKHDQQALANARTELLRKHGLPGLGGCLPLLLQLPIFWALSIILSNAIELYQAPFLWIPDLSARDPYFILPAIAAIAMIIHTPTMDPKQRFSSIAMSLVFAALIANFSAGLVLFIGVSTMLGIAQAVIAKRFV